MRFGAELRRLREAAGLSQSNVAARLGCTQTQVSRLEQATRTPQLKHAEVLDEIFDLTDKQYFAGMYRRIIASPGWPIWFLGWMEEVEPRAVVLRSWDPLLIPGLLQTEAYARHIFSGEPRISAEEVEERVRARMQRQSILNRKNPPTLIALIDEGVLHRRVGSATVMRQQLQYLLEVARRPAVSIQLVNAECMPGLLGAFMIAQLPEGEPDTIHADSSAEGQVSVDHELVALMWNRYEAIRLWAYPERVSLKMIKDVMDQWI